MNRIWRDGKVCRRRYHKFAKITYRCLYRNQSSMDKQSEQTNEDNTSCNSFTTLAVFFARFIPIIHWLPNYRWRDSFFADLSAGLTMAVFSVPTGIAHAAICGVAPVYGLYTAIFPSFFYLMYGGFAILSLMTRSAIEKVYRLTHHAQLLQSSAVLFNGINTSTITTTPTSVLSTTSTTISHKTSTIKTALIGAALLTNSSNLNSSTGINFLNNTSLHGNSSDALIMNISVSSSNDSDSMVFGVSSSSGNKAANDQSTIEKPNPFFQDAVGFDKIGTDAAPIVASDFIDNSGNVGIDETANLKMVILKENGTEKTAAILINSGSDLPSAPAAAALVAAASKAAAATENTKLENGSNKNSIIIDNVAASAAAAASALLNDNRVKSVPIKTAINFSVDLRDIRPINVATTILFLSAIIQILMGIFHLDFLSCYLSEQIMSGFVLGGCVHVFFSQIGDVLGITLPPRSGRGYLYNRVIDLIARQNEIHTPTAMISSCSIAFLLFSQKILEPWLSSVFQFPIPYELILVIVGITATNFAQLSKRHSITVVGNVPTNFPAPSLPRFDVISLIFFDAVSITIIAVAIHLTVVKIVENRYHYKINSCKELYSLGFAGLCASMFPVFPVTSIFARTLIGDADKNSTQMTIFFSSMGLVAVILYVGPALEYLPKCILASMVVVSLSASFSKFNELRTLWPLFKFDFVIFLASFTLTVCYDMAEGLTFTVAFAIFTIVVRDQWPKWHFLSHDKECNEFKETPKQQIHELDGNACVLRYDAPLIYPNVHKFLKVVEHGVKQWERRQNNHSNTNSLKSNHSAKVIGATDASKNCEKGYQQRCILERSTYQNNTITLIIDCSGFPYVDYLGLCTLKRVYKEFSEKNITVKFAAPKAILLQMFRNTDFTKTVPDVTIYATVRHAVQSTYS